MGRERRRRNKKGRDGGLSLAIPLSFIMESFFGRHTEFAIKQLECFSSPNGKILNLIKQLFKIAFIAYIALICFYFMSYVISFYLMYFDYSEDSRDSQGYEILDLMLLLSVSSFCILLRN